MQNTNPRYTPGITQGSMNSNMIKAEEHQSIHDQIDAFFGNGGTIKTEALTDRTKMRGHERFSIKRGHEDMRATK